MRTAIAKPRQSTSKQKARLPAALALLASLIAASCALPTMDRKGYALLIGISDYENNLKVNDLISPADDAASMDTLLRSQDWTTQLITDAQAGKTAIHDAIRTFFASVPEDATALVYYSGHGTDSLDGTESYIVPYDTDASLGSLISSEELSAWLSDNVPTKNLIVMLDSCNSGGFVAPSDALDSIDQAYNPPWSSSASVSPLAGLGSFGELLSLNTKARGTLDPIVISAAGADEYSWESSILKHGVFTYYLLDAAESGDENGDGFVTCTEAYNHAAVSIDRHWNDVYGLSSDYVFYPHISGGMRDLVLFVK